MNLWTYPILKFLFVLPVMFVFLGEGHAQEDDDSFFNSFSDTMTIPPSAPSEPKRVGGRIVCVRTCDGYFFPLPVSVGREHADEMCQALCPATVTRAYSMSMSGTINQAMSMTGSSYNALPNAGAYEKKHDPQCACRPHGESWEKALEPAEALLGPPLPTDILVTAENEKRVALLVSGQKEAKKKDKGGDSEDSSKDILTAGSQSSGVGPKITHEQNIQRLPPSSQAATASTHPRTIAPHIIPVPSRSN